MIHLIFILAVIVSLFIPTAWKLPQGVVTFAAVFWVALLLVVLGVGRCSSFKRANSEDAAKFAKANGFYFLCPNFSCLVSLMAAKWQLVSIVACLLSQGWLAIGASVLMYLACAFLRPLCSPIFFAEEGLRKYHADPQGAAFFSNRLNLLKAVYYKIHGEGDPPR